jgi:hypothetical protein
MDQNLEQTKYLRNLRRKIANHFDLGELKVLCFDARVDYDELAGETLLEKVLNLINHLSRRGRLEDLIELLKEERPHVDWDENIPSPEQQIEDAEKLIPPAKDDLVLREYLEKLEEYLPSDALQKAEQDRQLYDTIHALTKTYMQQLDLYRRTRLVRHLSENKLQKAVSLAEVDLSGADLSGIDLQDANLSKARLTTAFLANSNLQRANLQGAYLEAAFLQGANLQEANLTDAIISGTDFSYANLRKSLLDGMHRNSYGKYGHVEPKFDYVLLSDMKSLIEIAKMHLEARNNYEAALHLCNQLCELDETNGWHYFLRGLAYQGLAQEDLSRHDFLKALELSDEKEHLRYLYLAALGDLDSAKLEEYTKIPLPALKALQDSLQLLLGIFPNNEAATRLINAYNKCIGRTRRRAG